MNNSITIDGVEHWDLTAEEIVIDAPIDGASVRWHFRPYAVGAAKTFLKSVAHKYKLMTGGVTEAISGDPTAYASFFDAHFLKMSDVIGTDGNELSLDDQIAWLTDNPQIKAEVVNVLFKPEAIEQAEEAEQPKGKTVLVMRAGAESSHKVRAWINGANLEIKITHHLNRPSAKDRMAYDRCVSRNRMDSKHNTFQILMDYDSVEGLYDRLSVSIDRVSVGLIRCVESNKIEWVRRVPFWWKTYVIDDVFGQDRIKNG